MGESLSSKFDYLLIYIFKCTNFFNLIKFFFIWHRIIHNCIILSTLSLSETLTFSLRVFFNIYNN